MTLVSVFLMNLLCSMVPCDYKNPHPEISYNNSLSENSDLKIFSSFRGKRLILQESYPIVSTEGGLVQGYTMRVMSGRKISAFEGIPYGTVEKRFEISRPAKPWTGVRTAFQPGPHCLQIHAGKMFRVLGSEKNCLSINVYTPKLPTEGINQNLSVIVYIHGGSFSFGAGVEYGPSYLLEKDVILVSMNYRLGVLGFLSEHNISSNNGLKDQALALEWVKNNIHHFGGSSSKVTLLGQSAGAAAVHLHMLSNMTRNLFSKAVAMSGSAHAHWAINSKERAKHFTTKIAEKVNCPTKDSTELVDCLRRVDGNWLVAAQMNLFDWMPFPPVLFAPVIEPEGPNAFLTESPEEIYKKGNEAKVPAIFTMTSQEGYFSNYALNGMMKIGSFINNVRKYLPLYLDYNYITENPEVFTDKILFQYFGNTPPRNVPITKYAEMSSDRMFTLSINKAIKYHSYQSPTYSSLFSFLGKYNVGNAVGVPPNELGVAHSEDLYYVFNASLYLQGFKQKDEEAQLSKILVNVLTNFAEKGEPLYTDENGHDIKVWEPVNSADNEVRMLEFNRDVKMIDDPFVERRKFWENLGLADMTPIANLNATRFNKDTDYESSTLSNSLRMKV